MKYHIGTSYIITTKIKTAETVLRNIHLKYSSKGDNDTLVHWHYQISAII
jgi:hypothetical protein